MNCDVTRLHNWGRVKIHCLGKGQSARSQDSRGLCPINLDLGQTDTQQQKNGRQDRVIEDQELVSLVVAESLVQARRQIIEERLVNLAVVVLEVELGGLLAFEIALDQ